MGRRGAPDKKNLYVVFSYSFFKAEAQSGCVLIAVNNSVSNKPTAPAPTSATCAGHHLVTPLSDFLCWLNSIFVCVQYVCLVFRSPVDLSSKCCPLMISQL